MASPYTSDFYTLIDKRSRSSADAVAPILIDLVDPRSVVDVGCGRGTWLAAFASRGVSDVAGVDGAWVDTSALHIPSERFTRADVAQPIHLGRRFDLAICLEVGEHLPAASAATLVASLTGLAPVVAFSAAVPFQTGVNHVNEQWPDYWIELFGRHGFRPVDCVRQKIWTNPDVEWWYAQNTFVFVDERGPKAGLLQSARQSGWPTAMVHPKNFMRAGAAEAKKPEDYGVAFLAGAIVRAARTAVRKRLNGGPARRASDAPRPQQV